jgi:hypothetical protein
MLSAVGQMAAVAVMETLYLAHLEIAEAVEAVAVALLVLAFKI